MFINAVKASCRLLSSALSGKAAKYGKGSLKLIWAADSILREVLKAAVAVLVSGESQQVAIAVAEMAIASHVPSPLLRAVLFKVVEYAVPC